ncbi:MAG: hypothetical protein JWO11_1273 [Nocardioides sp.]|nr:hypothetical protein [Nocardioides sp.]
MKFTQRLGITIAAATVSIGLLGISTPAQADTSWGCGGYCRTGPK